MIRYIFCTILSFMSGLCLADNVKLEIASLDLSKDITSLPSFLNFESDMLVNINLNYSNLSNMFTMINYHLAQDLQRKYTNLIILDIESGVLDKVLMNNQVESFDFASEQQLDYNADYVLYGKVSNFNSVLVTRNIDNQVESSLLYYLNIAIHYQIIRVKDTKIVADFIALGSAGDAFIKSKLYAIDYNRYVTEMLDSLYSSVYSGVIRSVENKGILSSANSYKNNESINMIVDK